MKNLVVIPTVLAVIALIGAFPTAFASHSTPLNGSFSGTFTFTGAGKGIVTATGHFSHLGETTLVATATTTGTADCKGGLTATEQETFTAANGDKIFSTATDVGCPVSATLFHVSASSTITGGTGRFADASGSFTTEVDAVFTSQTTATISATSTGTITY